MRVFLIVVFSVICSSAFSSSKNTPPIKNKATKNKHAHEHGVAKLEISVEGKSAQIEFESPSESIYGFEHKATQEKDIKMRDVAILKFEQNFAQMVILDFKLGCQFAKKSIEPFVVDEEDHHKGKKTKEHHGGEHSETHAEFSLTCKESLAGSKVKFAFKKFFPKLSTLDVQIVSDSKQLGGRIKNDVGEYVF